MQTDFEGYYLDGHTAGRQKAVIRITVTGLHISTENGPTCWWPYDEIRQTQGFYRGEQVRLERGENICEVLLVPDAQFFEALRHVVPKQAVLFHGPTHRSRRITIILVSALGTIGFVAFLYLFGIPVIASRAAPFVPVSWEEHLGQAVVGHLAPPDRRCDDETRVQAIEKISQILTSTLPKKRYRFRVIVMNDPRVNAFAAPGGYIVIFRGLLEMAETPEELAGVLAHELQHIVHQHVTCALFQHASIRLLLAAMAGDANSAMSFGLESARFLATLRYSREHEEEADREGMKMVLRARIDPRGMITIFEKLQKEGKRSLRVPTYLSTHPNLETRIRLFKSLADKSQIMPVPLLEGNDWSDIRRLCEKQGNVLKRGRP